MAKTTTAGATAGADLRDFVTRAAVQIGTAAATIRDAHHVAVETNPVAGLVLEDLIGDTRRLQDRLARLAGLLEPGASATRVAAWAGLLAERGRI